MLLSSHPIVDAKPPSFLCLESVKIAYHMTECDLEMKIRSRVKRMGLEIKIRSRKNAPN